MLEHVILRATNGKQKGQEFVLDNEGDYTLGRAKECSCVLNDPLYLVSRRHCRIKVHTPSVCVQDLGSRNGTQVNGMNIGRDKNSLFEQVPQGPYTEHPLEDGDTLRIAGYEFEVEFEPDPPCAEFEPRDQEQLWSCTCAAL